MQPYMQPSMQPIGVQQPIDVQPSERDRRYQRELRDQLLDLQVRAAGAAPQEQANLQLLISQIRRQLD